MTAPFSGQCNVSSDCAVGLIQKECYETVPWSDLEFFCECSSWYGYTGPSCDETSIQVTYQRIFLPVAALWGCILLVLYCCHIFNYIQWKRKSPMKNPHNPIFWVSILSCIGVVLFLISFLLLLPPAFDPNLFVTEDYGTTSTTLEQVTGKGGKLSSILLTAGTCFYVMSALQISLSWVNLADSLNMIKIPRFPMLAKSFRKFVIFAQIMYFALILCFFAANVFYLVGLMTASLAIIFSCFFFVGRRRLISAVKFSTTGSANQQQMFQNALKFTKKSSFITIFLMFVIVFPFSSYGLMLGTWKERIAVGEFNYVLFFRDIVTAIAYMLFSFNLWYCQKIFDNLSRRSKEKAEKARLRSAAESSLASPMPSRLRPSSFVVSADGESIQI